MAATPGVTVVSPLLLVASSLRVRSACTSSAMVMAALLAVPVAEAS
jgi:hypothetical protein